MWECLGAVLVMWGGCEWNLGDSEECQGYAGVGGDSEGWGKTLG